MRLHALLLAASTSAPLFAQAGWTTSPIAPAEQCHRPSVAVGDVDGDGIDDLVLGRNGVIVVRRGTQPAPDRTFDAREHPLPARERFLPGPVAVTPSCESAGQPRLADLDHDGDLDIVAIDGVSGAECIVWFANDGRGSFAAPRDVPVAGGARFVVRGQMRTIDLADVDHDGRLDLLINTGELTLHPGSEGGFAAAGRNLGMKNRGAAALADWDADGTIDLLLVDDGAVTLRRGIRGDYAPAERLTAVAGDSSLVQLAVADWNGDRRVDLLLGETLPRTVPAAPVDRATAAELEARRRAAKLVVDAVQQEIARLNATKPPRDDPAAMASRAAWRDQLGRWVEEPRAVVEGTHLQATTSPGGRLRAEIRH